MRRLILGLCLLSMGSVVDAADRATEREIDRVIQQAHEKELWKKKDWLRLGHYQKRLFGRYRSQADGVDFFLAGQKGKDHPDQELEATLRGFFRSPQDVNDKDHPQCRFPARMSWLQSELRWNSKFLPSAGCLDYERFRQQLSASSVTLVFSSYYLNNPASAFGHTFLRMNKRVSSRTGERHELLDYGINYAAQARLSDPITYAFKGLTGLFKGTFSKLPYYYKVREYNDAESRDLWEYNLNLSTDEVRMLVAHLWELGGTYFDYYYLSENCSYHILSAVEAVMPEISLTSPLRFYVIPADTVKAVYRIPTLITGVHYRPSIRSQFGTRLETLSSFEKKILRKILAKRHLAFIPEDLPVERKVAILDTAIDAHDFRNFREINEGVNSESEFKQQLLVARSRLAVSSPPLVVEAPVSEMPQEGHEAARLGTGFGSSTQEGPYFGLSHRFALHDLLDSQMGYPPSAEIEFLSIDIRKNFREDWFWVEEASLFHVVSLSDMTRFHHPFSWKFRVGGRTFRDTVCNNCFGGLIEGGLGISKKLTREQPVWLSLMLEGEGSGSTRFEGPPFRFRYGPSTFIRWGVHPNLQWGGGLQYRRPLISSFSTSAMAWSQLRWGLMKSLALDLEGRRLWMPDTWEGGVSLFYYYK